MVYQKRNPLTVYFLDRFLIGLEYLFKRGALGLVQQTGTSHVIALKTG